MEPPQGQQKRTRRTSESPCVLSLTVNNLPSCQHLVKHQCKDRDENGRSCCEFCMAKRILQRKRTVAMQNAIKCEDLQQTSARLLEESCPEQRQRADGGVELHYSSGVMGEFIKLTQVQYSFT